MSVAVHSKSVIFVANFAPSSRKFWRMHELLGGAATVTPLKKCNSPVILDNGEDYYFMV